jgi:hypothetical protein
MKESPVKKPVHKGKKVEPKLGKNVKKFGMYWGLYRNRKLLFDYIKLHYVIDNFIFFFIFL